MKRLGLLGYGTVASYGHLPAVAQTPELQMAAVYDPAPARLAALREAWPGVQACDDLEALLSADIDAVVITDAGHTEFGGVPTVTCAGIGPASAAEIDRITGHLKPL